MTNSSRLSSNFIISRSIGNFYFWGSVSVPYFVHRGFSLQAALSMIGIYAFLNVVFEFPTGVIGDVYGHKTAVVLSDILGTVAMLLLALPLPHIYYYGVITLLAIASSLISGSDIALLKSISTDFKRDLSRLKAQESIFLFMALSLAGFIGKINLVLPLLLTAFSWLTAGILVYRLTIPKTTRPLGSGNIYQTSISSIKQVLASIPLLAVILYASVNGGFMISSKTLINSLTPFAGLDLSLVGLVVGLSMLARSFGYRYSRYLDKVRTRYIFLLSSCILFLVAFLPLSGSSIAILATLGALLALIELRSEVDINNLVPDYLRASILSLKNLLVRLFSALYLISTGIVLERWGFKSLILSTILVFTVTGFTYLRITKNRTHVVPIFNPNSRQTE